MPDPLIVLLFLAIGAVGLLILLSLLPPSDDGL